MVVLAVLLLVLLPRTLCKSPSVTCKVSHPHPPLHEYHQSEVLIIGSIASHVFILSDPAAFTQEPSTELHEDLEAVPKNYQHILALAFALKEINENPQLLPNVTLGFHIYDSYFNENWTYHNTMLLLSTPERFSPNYKCDLQNNLIAVIGGLDPQISFHIATLLDIYKIPQLIYGAAPVMNEKIPGLPFYQLAPKEALQNKGIISLLLHFGWKWIGVITVDTDNGDRFVQSMLSAFSQSGICFAFIEKSPKLTFASGVQDQLNQGAKIHDKVFDSRANVVVVYGDSYSVAFLIWLPYLSESYTNKSPGKVWIMTAQMELMSFVYQRTLDTDIIHGALGFTTHSSDPAGFHQFVKSRNPSTTKGDSFIWDFWQQVFGCVFPHAVEDKLEGDICTGEEKLEHLPGTFFEMAMTGHSYIIYRAAYALAYALHAMSSSNLKYRAMVNGGRLDLQTHQLWQVMDRTLYFGLIKGLQSA